MDITLKTYDSNGYIVQEALGSFAIMQLLDLLLQNAQHCAPYVTINNHTDIYGNNCDWCTTIHCDNLSYVFENIPFTTDKKGFLHIDKAKIQKMIYDNIIKTIEGGE